MHMREKLRQRAVAAESENHARRAENVAGHKTESGNRRARDQDRSTDVAEKFRGRFGERRDWAAIDAWVAATLAAWYGLAPADLPAVFPNLSKFASSNLGFLG